MPVVEPPAFQAFVFALLAAWALLRISARIRNTPGLPPLQRHFRNEAAGFPRFAARMSLLEWASPAAIVAAPIARWWLSGDFTLHSFRDRLIGAPVLHLADLSRRSEVLVSSILLVAAGSIAIAGATFFLSRLLLAAGLASPARLTLLRRALTPVHVCSAVFLIALGIGPRVPESEILLFVLSAFAIYFFAAAMFVLLPGLFLDERSVPAGLVHSVALALFCLASAFQMFVLGRSLDGPFFVVVSALVIVAWLVAARLKHRSRDFDSWIRRAHRGLLILGVMPAIGYLAAEGAYFLMLRFGVAVPFSRMRLVLFLVAAAAALAAVVIPPRRSVAKPRLSTSKFFSIRLAPLSLGAFILTAFRLPPGADLTIDIHHMGEALLPIHQLLEFGAIPYVDLMPTHGIWNGLGLVVHRLLFGTYSVDAVHLWVPVTRAIGFLATYWFLLRATRSVAAAFTIPLALYMLLNPGLGYLAPVYTIGLVVLILIGEAFRRRTRRAMLIAGAGAVAMMAFRLDAGVALLAVGTVLIVFDALAGRRAGMKARFATGAFFWIAPLAAAVLFVATLFATSADAVSILRIITQFFSADFQLLHTGALDLYSAGVPDPLQYLFHILLPLGTVLVAVALAARVWSSALASGRSDWMSLLAIGLIGYNTHVFNRTLGRFTDAVIGGDHPSQYTVAWSAFAFAYGASLLATSSPRLPASARGLPLVRRVPALAIWLVAIGVTLISSERALLARLPVQIARMKTETIVAPSPATGSLSHRYSIDPEVETAFDQIEAYVDANLEPDQTFAELGNQPLLYVTLNRRFPGYLTLMISTVTDTSQRHYVDRVERANIPLVILHGDQRWLNDVDGVPDAVRNYRIHEWVHAHYARSGRVGPFVTYERRNGGGEATPFAVVLEGDLPSRSAEVSAGATTEIRVVGKSAIVELPLAALEARIGESEEATLDLEMKSPFAGSYAFRFLPAGGPISMPVSIEHPDREGEWVRHQIPSPSEFRGTLDRIRFDPPPAIDQGTIEIRDLTLRVGPKSAAIDPPVRPVWELRHLPLVWGELDPARAAFTTPLLWSASIPSGGVTIGPGETRDWPLALAPGPANYLHLVAAAVSGEEIPLYVNYEKQRVPLSTPKGFRFLIKGDGEPHDYLIRPSSQPYWYGDRSPLTRITVTNQSTVPVEVRSLAVRLGD